MAMPFLTLSVIGQMTVYKEIIQKAAEVANGKPQAAKRKFDVPRRVDDAPGQAVVITEDIVVGIL